MSVAVISLLLVDTPCWLELWFLALDVLVIIVFQFAFLQKLLIFTETCVQMCVYVCVQYYKDNIKQVDVIQLD